MGFYYYKRKILYAQPFLLSTPTFFIIYEKSGCSQQKWRVHVEFPIIKTNSVMKMFKPRKKKKNHPSDQIGRTIQSASCDHNVGQTQFAVHILYHVCFERVISPVGGWHEIQGEAGGHASLTLGSGRWLCRQGRPCHLVSVGAVKLKGLEVIKKINKVNLKNA